MSKKWRENPSKTDSKVTQISGKTHSAQSGKCCTARREPFHPKFRPFLGVPDEVWCALQAAPTSRSLWLEHVHSGRGCHHLHDKVALRPNQRRQALACLRVSVLKGHLVAFKGSTVNESKRRQFESLYFQPLQLIFRPKFAAKLGQ